MTQERPNAIKAHAPLPSGVPAWVATLVVAGGLPVTLVLAGGASWRAAGLGALSWVIGFAVKLPVAGELSVVISQRRPVLRAIGLGLASAASELGVAAWLFQYAHVTSRMDVLVYAVAAGCLESLLLGLSGVFSKSDTKIVEQWAAEARHSFWVRNSMLVERLIALGGHLGSRGLICITLLTGTAWPALFAVLSFTFTDGWATFGHERHWNWYSPRTFRMFHGGCAAVAAVEIAIFLLLLLGLRSVRLSVH